jgi:general secretion pathway protein C
MAKKYIWIKNLVFLIFFSYLAAQIGNQVILAAIPDSNLPGQQGKPAKPVKEPPKNTSLLSYKIISTRNIFNSEYVGEEAVDPTKVVRTNAPLKKTELSVKLIGTVVGRPEQSFAVVEDQKTSQQELFRIDDMIQDVARVLEISRCRVVVLREGAQEILECPEEEEKRPQQGPQVAAGATAEESGTIKKVSENEYLIDESEVQGALDNINDLITQLRVVPNFQDGKANGFKVFAIKPNSLFSKIGLRNGDVIQKINDSDITTPDKAFQAFQNLRNEKSLNVEIIRRGGPQSLRYEIR